MCMIVHNLSLPPSLRIMGRITYGNFSFPHPDPVTCSTKFADHMMNESRHSVRIRTASDKCTKPGNGARPLPSSKFLEFCLNAIGK